MVFIPVVYSMLISRALGIQGVVSADGTISAEEVLFQEPSCDHETVCGTAGEVWGCWSGSKGATPRCHGDPNVYKAAVAELDQGSVEWEAAKNGAVKACKCSCPQMKSCSKPSTTTATTTTTTTTTKSDDDSVKVYDDSVKVYDDGSGADDSVKVYDGGNGADDGTAVGDTKYEVGELGKLCGQQQVIFNKTACKEAASDLEFDFKRKSKKVKTVDYPKGCYLVDARVVVFNKPKDTEYGNQNADATPITPICMKQTL